MPSSPHARVQRQGNRSNKQPSHAAWPSRGCRGAVCAVVTIRRQVPIGFGGRSGVALCSPSLASVIVLCRDQLRPGLDRTKRTFYADGAASLSAGRATMSPAAISRPGSGQEARASGAGEVRVGNMVGRATRGGAPWCDGVTRPSRRSQSISKLCPARCGKLPRSAERRSGANTGRRPGLQDMCLCSLGSVRHRRRTGSPVSRAVASRRPGHARAEAQSNQQQGLNTQSRRRQARDEIQGQTRGQSRSRRTPQRRRTVRHARHPRAAP